MKSIKLIIIGICLFFVGEMQAQISVNIQLGSPPQWGPAENTQVRYYYLPDVEAYYDIQDSKFIYYSQHRWVRRSYLPKAYRNYDLYKGYKVLLSDYRGNTPYTYFKAHQKKYFKGYNHGQEQKTIGKRPTNKKYKSKHHKKHSDDDNYKDERGQNNSQTKR